MSDKSTNGKTQTRIFIFHVDLIQHRVINYAVTIVFIYTSIRTIRSASIIVTEKHATSK